MRVHFMLMDVVELRKCNWIPQKEDGNPKTIDQIHKEVQGPEKNTKGWYSSCFSLFVFREINFSFMHRHIFTSKEQLVLFIARARYCKILIV